MAFDKCKRFPKFTTQTSVNVGPGTYDVQNSPRILHDPENAYPFLTGSKRRTIIISRDVKQFPGPGSYCIKEPYRHILESVSIDYTEERFKRKFYEGPGPTEYDVDTNLLKKPKKRPHLCPWGGPAGKLWLMRPPRSIMISGLAVPTKKDSGGYDFDRRGILIKNPPEKYNPTVFYDVPREETNFTTLRYKGNFWSRMTGRVEKRAPGTPGPGDYEHKTEKTLMQIHDDKIRENKRRSSKQLRYLDILCKNKLRENLPGPDSYDLKSTFEKFVKISCKCDPYTSKTAPFGQTSERFRYKISSDTPEPGSYDPMYPKCTSSISSAPFGARAGRFRKVIGQSGPAPSDYHSNVGNLAYESSKRYKCKYGKPEYHINNKELIPIKENIDSTASSTESIKEKQKSLVHHAVFKSGTQRFPENYKEDDVPGPGAYEALSSFKANRDKRDFFPDRLTPSFGSRVDRFPKIPIGVDINTPNSTTYDVRCDIGTNVKGGVISFPRGTRESQLKLSNPPYYSIHPYVGSSVIKKTFNVTLGKPNIIRDLSNSKLPNSQSCRACAKKTLRCFTTTNHNILD